MNGDTARSSLFQHVASGLTAGEILALDTIRNVLPAGVEVCRLTHATLKMDGEEFFYLMEKLNVATVAFNRGKNRAIDGCVWDVSVNMFKDFYQTVQAAAKLGGRQPSPKLFDLSLSKIKEIRQGLESARDSALLYMRQVEARLNKSKRQLAKEDNEDNRADLTAAQVDLSLAKKRYIWFGFEIGRIGKLLKKMPQAS